MTSVTKPRPRQTNTHPLSLVNNHLAKNRNALAYYRAALSQMSQNVSTNKQKQTNIVEQRIDTIEGFVLLFFWKTFDITTRFLFLRFVYVSRGRG